MDALRAFAAGEAPEGVFVGHATQRMNSSPDQRRSAWSGAAVRRPVMSKLAKAYAAATRGRPSYALYGAGRRRAFLPNYPFQRQRYWFDGSRTSDEAPLSMLSEAAAHCFHLVDWRESPVVERTLPEDVSDVIVFGDGRGVGTALASMLAGPLLVAAILSNTATTLNACHERRGASIRDAARTTRARLRRHREPKVTASAILFLSRPSDDLALASDSMPVAALAAAQKRGTLAIINVLQAALSRKSARPARARIVTRGAVRLDMDTGPVNLMHAGAWGLLRDASPWSSRPSKSGRGGPRARRSVPSQDEAAALLAELGAPPGEDHVAWRGRRRLVGRLRRGPPAARRSVDIAPDRCHLVTGALGEIGVAGGALARRARWAGYRADALDGRPIRPRRRNARRFATLGHAYRDRVG